MQEKAKKGELRAVQQPGKPERKRRRWDQMGEDNATPAAGSTTPAGATPKKAKSSWDQAEVR